MRIHAIRTAYRQGVLIALAALVAVFAVTTPSTFLTVGNLTTILSSQALLMVITLGLTFPLAAGEFDLSIGAVLGFGSGMLAYLTVLHGVDLGVAIAITLVVGALVGAINGVLVVFFSVNALIATLGIGTVLTGIGTALTKGQLITNIPQPLVDAMRKEIWGLQLPVYGALALAVVVWYLYELTPAGRYLIFTGESREAARLAGVPVQRVRFLAFIGSAVTSTIAGLISAGTLAVHDPTVGPQYLLPAYAAAFLGATTIKPGRYNAWGTVVALYLVVTGVTGLQLLGVESWVQQVFQGGILVTAVVLARVAAVHSPEVM